MPSLSAADRARSSLIGTIENILLEVVQVSSDQELESLDLQQKNPSFTGRYRQFLASPEKAH
jgi:hypothetical protein